MTSGPTGRGNVTPAFAALQSAFARLVGNAPGRIAPKAFGHYGYGGSGGWADPTIGLSVGFVTNRIGSLTTPLGDLTLYRLNRTVRECAVLGPGA
jgi:CubicO group peptidase (beta-lactamase class C family)